KKELTDEFAEAEKNISITLEKTAKAGKSFDEKRSLDMVRFLFLAPNGFKEKSPLIEGLTVTSLNLGVIKTHDDTVNIMHSVRSVFASARDELSDEIKTLAGMCGADVRYMADYPGWNFKEDSRLRELLAAALMKISGKELKTSAVHGGNECGVFSSFGVEDIISFGPVMEDIHTPKERLNLPSFDRCYAILLEILRSCNK
ncbi:MAG: M20/M25/M40 family metallo-hydrolase, partial [Erysipelotrichaceae bacterium]|nr:M20/M25/M40 family metallo-hydrolase [Erysipelotrichaceae bacterium]